MFGFQPLKEFKTKKIKKNKREIELQDIFLDQLVQSREKELGISEKKIEAPLSQKILQVTRILFLILIFLLLAKTIQFQVLDNKKFLLLAQQNKFIESKLRAERGVIYDQNFNQLVFNRPAFDLICQKSQLPKDQEKKIKIIKEISKIINQDFQKLAKEIENSSAISFPILKNIPYRTLILLETKIEEFPGFRIENNTVREYFQGPVLAHLLGYTGKISAPELKENPEVYSVKDWVGKSGIEKAYEDILRKKPGKLRIERDALGNRISEEIVSLPESGKSLVLWLDLELQKKIEKELRKAIQSLGAEGGAAVALDPNTGGVLALVSLPSFDNNLFSQIKKDPSALENLLKDPHHPLFNRAISGLGYPVGSVIKPLIGVAALEEKIIFPKTTFNCQGKIQIQDQWNPEIWHEFRDWKAHGITDIYKAIAESCNVFFYIIGGGYKEFSGLGPTKIKNWLKKFSWGNPTGIDLPGEGSGFLPDPGWKKESLGEIWYDGDTYHLSIGQGYISVTPLQVATAFSAIANGGKIYKPKVVQKIVDSDKNLIKEIKPEVLNQAFISPQNLEVVRRGMREAVIYGSALLLNDLPVKVAAKTGTAQSITKKDYYHHWVTVFAPYENPKIVLTILIENVKGVQFASLPVAKEVLQWFFSNSKNFTPQ